MYENNVCEMRRHFVTIKSKVLRFELLKEVTNCSLIPWNQELRGEIATSQKANVRSQNNSSFAHNFD